MTNQNRQKIIVKIGTNVITRDDGMLNEDIMEHIAFQIAELKKKNFDIVIVSSGAMAAGRTYAPAYCRRNKIIHRQLLAAIGQVELMSSYSRIFDDFGSVVAQVLSTKEDFRSRSHYLNMKNCFEALLEDHVIPIVNENDVVSVTELMFTDNDELAGMIASMLDVNTVILLTSVDGLYDGKPDDPNSKIIKEIDPQKQGCEKYVQKSKSQFGVGGMLTKCRIAKTLSSVGIETYIANGQSENVLMDIMDGKGTGTRFIPQKNVSIVKKWVAFSKGYEKGSIYVNKGARDALKAKVSSVLPVGVIKIDGVFEKGDIIKVLSEDGNFLGLGKSEYSSEEGQKIIGKHDEKPFIHYDYLFIY
ncbi:glutamate 5-kinase [Patescibacteria group bacterium]